MRTYPTRRAQLAVAGACFAAGLVSGVVFLAAAQTAQPAPAERWRQAFARPGSVPHPAGNLPSPEKITLGARLFADPALSASGTIACATCHNPTLGLADGVPLSRAGVTGVPLRRHTPALWNLAWAPVLYWDGRAADLEAQARIPMSHPDEMASPPEAAAARLQSDASYRDQFRSAFPGEPMITAEQILRAIAAFERTLVSPPTRFDAWIAGDAAALDPSQRLGFALFTGKAGCSNCHSGFAFTDFAFHDVGLPGTDKGRGTVIALAQADHAFKTPTLRELAWTAPYMHDGSLATLEDVIQHYERGGVTRASRSPDMPKPFTLTVGERQALIGFLESLSSEAPPRPSTEAWIGRPAQSATVAGSQARTVSQREKMFAPASINARMGETIRILNDDTRTHNVRIVDPRWSFNSGAQEAGESLSLKLDHRGVFEAHCGIHPAMRLRIEVE